VHQLCKNPTFSGHGDSFERKADSPICWKHCWLRVEEGAVGVGFGAPKTGSYVPSRRPRVRVHPPREQFRVTLCPNAKYSDFFVLLLACKEACDRDVPKTCQNFGP
jgi:hypothetical protein